MATKMGKQPFDEHADFVVNYKLFKLCLTDDTNWETAPSTITQSDAYLQLFKGAAGEVMLDTFKKRAAYTTVIEYHNTVESHEELSGAAREWSHFRARHHANEIA